jgi:hypothetical protein
MSFSLMPESMDFASSTAAIGLSFSRSFLQDTEMDSKANIGIAVFKNFIDIY